MGSFELVQSRDEPGKKKARECVVECRVKIGGMRRKKAAEKGCRPTPGDADLVSQ